MTSAAADAPQAGADNQTDRADGNAPPEVAPPEGDAAPMLKHLDIRQTADNYYDKM